MEEMMTLQIQVPRSLVETLNRLATMHKMAHPKPEKMSMNEWLRSTESGKHWTWRLQADAVLRAKPIDEVNRLQKKAYLEAIGGTRMGRPPFNDARIIVLTEALRQYQERPQLTLAKSA